MCHTERVNCTFTACTQQLNTLSHGLTGAAVCDVRCVNCISTRGALFSDLYPLCTHIIFKNHRLRTHQAFAHQFTTSHQGANRQNTAAERVITVPMSNCQMLILLSLINQLHDMSKFLYIINNFIFLFTYIQVFFLIII